MLLASALLKKHSGGVPSEAILMSLKVKDVLGPAGRNVEFASSDSVRTARMSGESPDPDTPVEGKAKSSSKGDEGGPYQSSDDEGDESCSCWNPFSSVSRPHRDHGDQQQPLMPTRPPIPEKPPGGFSR